MILIKLVILILVIIYGGLHLYGCLKVFCKRLIFLFQIKSIARKYKNLTIKIKWPIYFFSWNKTVIPSLIVETPESIYLVKLCGSFRRLDFFIFVNSSHWIQRSFWGATKNIRPKPLFVDSEIQESYKLLKIIYLFVPSSRLSNFAQTGRGLKKLSCGALIAGGLLYNANRFLLLLAEEGERSESFYDVASF